MPKIASTPNAALARLAASAQVMPSVLAHRPDLVEAGKAFVAKSQAVNTARAFQFDWTVFENWCTANKDAQALPASVDTIFAFLTDMAKTRALETVRRYRATISKAHGLAGHPSPCYSPQIRKLMEGIRRSKGAASPGAKKPVTAAVATKIFEGLDSKVPSLRGLRDRAVLLFGLASALRREELCSIDVEDLQRRPEGIAFWLGKSKTDQAGEGRFMGIPALAAAPDRCPVLAVETWMAAAGISSGPLFRRLRRLAKRADQMAPAAITAERMHPSQVNKILKRAAGSAGLDPKVFGAHSLRSGYVTQARKDGFDWLTIMEQTGHRKLDTVKRYAREEEGLDPFKNTKVKEIFAAYAKKEE